MSISKAILNDVAELVSLINNAYRGENSSRGWTSESHLLTGKRIDEEMLTEYISQKNSTLLKYIDEAGQIAGCVYLEEQTEKLYLGMLTVSPDLQASGIGRLLLEAAEQYAKTINKQMITMTVITTRHELLSWYERRGYKRTGKILPFHANEKFGKPKAHIELEVLEKEVK
ncbi:MAG: family N-acetyltransferase [Mucilaginibacter sp.]|nr:family N-acetyltransferase [Mucilaginibacter sp.]